MARDIKATKKVIKMMENLRTKRLLFILGYRSTEAEAKRLHHNVHVLSTGESVNEFRKDLEAQN